MCRCPVSGAVASGATLTPCVRRGAGLRRYAAVGAACVLTLGGCRTQPSLDEEARQYVRLAVALGERDPDSLDFYAGPAEMVADIRRDPPPLTAIERDAGSLAARIKARRATDQADRSRIDALARNLAAIAARIDLLNGGRPRFDRESTALFGLAPAPPDEPRLAAIRSRVAAVVGGKGPLVDRYAAFAERFTIPPERLAAVMGAALSACRTATLPHIELPAGETATLAVAHDKPWSAFSKYLGAGHSVISINADFRFTIDQALQVACHEGYPGHHTRNSWRTSPSAGAAARQPERAVQLTFSPESVVSEGAAMLAVDVAFPGEERVRVERDRLFPLANLAADAAASHVEVERLLGELQLVQADVARRYLDGALEFARAAAELEARALVPHAGPQIKYFNEYRSYVTAYTAGRVSFAARLDACGGAQPSPAVRWRCYQSESTR